MKKTTLALAISAAALAATPAFATNGDHLIGLGAKSRALGGTGIAAFYGAESALANPALLAKGKGNEITFAGTLFRPSVSTTGNGSTRSSAADKSVIPEVAIMNPINDKLTFGIGIFGTAGMGVDYRNNADRFNARTNLQLMKFAPSLAYKGKNWGVGGSLAVMYGSLDIAYTLYARNPGGTAATFNVVNVNPPFQVTIPAGGTIAGFANIPGSATNVIQQRGGMSGVSDDYGFGWQLGGYYDLTNNLTVAATYQSAISMKYKGQIANAAQDFGLGAGGANIITSDTLEQPATLGAGVSYRTGSYEMTADFKQIKWSDAQGYKQFGWQDQNVIALGVRYMGSGYWLGLGFNKGDNPIRKFNPAATGGAALNTLNYLMFPGTVEQHWTLGGGYRFSQKFSMDGAITYAPEVTDSVQAFGFGAPVGTLTTKHSQTAFTVSLRYDF